MTTQTRECVEEAEYRFAVTDGICETVKWRSKCCYFDDGDSEI